MKNIKTSILKTFKMAKLEEKEISKIIGGTRKVRVKRRCSRRISRRR